MQQKREDLRTRAKLAFQQERYEDSKNLMKELVEVSNIWEWKVIGCNKFKRATEQWRTQHAFKRLQELRCEEAGNFKKTTSTSKRTKFKRRNQRGWSTDVILYWQSDCYRLINMCRAAIHSQRHYSTNVLNRGELRRNGWCTESRQIGLGKHCVLQKDACWLFQIFGRSRGSGIGVSYFLFDSL